LTIAKSDFLFYFLFFSDLSKIYFDFFFKKTGDTMAFLQKKIGIYFDKSKKII